MAGSTQYALHLCCCRAGICQAFQNIGFHSMNPCLAAADDHSQIIKRLVFVSTSRPACKVAPNDLVALKLPTSDTIKLDSQAGLLVSLKSIVSSDSIYLQVSVKVGTEHLPMAVTVLEKSDVDLLFGLDMLRRYRCSIDLEKNCLRFGVLENTSLSFLPDHEIPNREASGTGSLTCPLTHLVTLDCMAAWLP